MPATSLNSTTVRGYLSPMWPTVRVPQKTSPPWLRAGKFQRHGSTFGARHVLKWQIPQPHRGSGSKQRLLLVRAAANPMPSSSTYGLCASRQRQWPKSKQKSDGRSREERPPDFGSASTWCTLAHAEPGGFKTVLRTSIQQRIPQVLPGRALAVHQITPDVIHIVAHNISDHTGHRAAQCRPIRHNVVAEF